MTRRSRPSSGPTRPWSKVRRGAGVVVADRVGLARLDQRRPPPARHQRLESRRSRRVSASIAVARLPWPADQRRPRRAAGANSSPRAAATAMHARPVRRRRRAGGDRTGRTPSRPSPTPVVVTRVGREAERREGRGRAGRPWRTARRPGPTAPDDRLPVPPGPTARVGAATGRPHPGRHRRRWPRSTAAGRGRRRVGPAEGWTARLGGRCRRGGRSSAVGASRVGVGARAGTTMPFGVGARTRRGDDCAASRRRGRGRPSGSVVGVGLGVGLGVGFGVGFGVGVGVGVGVAATAPIVTLPAARVASLLSFASRADDDRRGSRSGACPDQLKMTPCPTIRPGARSMACEVARRRWRSPRRRASRPRSETPP